MLGVELWNIGNSCDIHSFLGVKIIPALKLSRKENNTWNKRAIDEKRLEAASEVQRGLRMMATPKCVKSEDKKLFEDYGYKSVDETQVVRIETEKYFKYLIQMVTSAGTIFGLFGPYLVFGQFGPFLNRFCI